MFSKSGKKAPKEATLNISSLMDILTILLLFLILSFGSQEQDIIPPKDFEIPDSNSDLPVKLAVQVQVGPSTVMVEDKVVLQFRPGQSLKRTDLDKNNRIGPLLQELQRQKAKITSGKAIKEGSEDEQDIVYLQAAKDTRFDLLDMVLKTAAEAGFTKFRLAVHKRG